MATKEQVKEKIAQLIESDIDYVQKKIDKILNSGCLDLDNEDNNFVIPKCIISAIYSNLAYQYDQKPVWKKQIKNIKMFI